MFAEPPIASVPRAEFSPLPGKGSCRQAARHCPAAWGKPNRLVLAKIPASFKKVQRRQGCMTVTRASGQASESDRDLLFGERPRTVERCGPGGAAQPLPHGRQRRRLAAGTGISPGAASRDPLAKRSSAAARRSLGPGRPRSTIEQLQPAVPLAAGRQRKREHAIGPEITGPRRPGRGSIDGTADDGGAAGALEAAGLGLPAAGKWPTGCRRRCGGGCSPGWWRSPERPGESTWKPSHWSTNCWPANCPGCWPINFPS